MIKFDLRTSVSADCTYRNTERKEVEKMEQEYGPGATLNVNISKDGDKPEAGVGDVDDGSSVDPSTKRLNSGVSFVRIGIESGDEEENEIIEDSTKGQMKTETNTEENRQILAVDDATEQPVKTGGAYEMLEAEGDVWELDD